MTIEEVYQKYKHLDKLLSDAGLRLDEFKNQLISDLWRAVKEEAERRRKEKTNV